MYFTPETLLNHVFEDLRKPKAPNNGGDHFLVKIPEVLAFSVIENGHSWLFSTKMGVMWPLTIDQRLIHLTPHMFPCHRSHSWIFGGDHFLVKNPYVLAFCIIENGR
jgi:hypothetical protein